VDKVKQLPEGQPGLRFLEKEEIIRLVEACSDRVRPVVEVALNTSMRRGEIVGLKWSAVDFRRGLISLYLTKNNEQRIIPMNNTVRGILAKLREDSTTEEVFDTRGLREDFSRALKCAKIFECRFHNLRHTFASQLVMSGVDLVTVKELLGHKSIKMTMRYAYLSQDHKMKAGETLGSAIATNKAPSEEIEKLEKALNVVTH